MKTRFLLCCLLITTASLGFSGDDPSWLSKVDPWVMDTSRAGNTEFLVFLGEQADLTAVKHLRSKAAKGRAVYERLTATAAATQQPILDLLSTAGLEHRSFWVANMIWVRGGTETVQKLAEREDVQHIYANPRVNMRTLGRNDSGALATRSIEWNISHVGADLVWALGITGGGAVVAGQDTGYLWSHSALVDQYRGGAGNHDYNWHDAIHSNNSDCLGDSPEPCDDHGHGTHTMGTIIGDDGGTNQIGMAPGAQWIACRNMDDGYGTPDSYAECYEFFIAPTDLADENPDPGRAPHVINNSWSCPESEGCTDPNELLTVVNNVRAAGIVTVHSAGNEGSGCSSVATPSAIYDASFSVGASDWNDDIAGFSSRGPVTVDGSGRMKPDITAPGEDIRSSTRDGDYQSGWSGTSMAGPHVAGLVALMISANPTLAGDVDTIEQIIRDTAVPLTTNQGCGGDGPTDVPNNVYGWGRIDALAAVNAALALSPPEIFADGFEGGDTSTWSESFE